MTGINQIVRAVIDSHPAGEVLWASGGDGGHVAFFARDWQQSALKLFQTLRDWAASNSVPLRIVGHYGPVHRITGADDRTQPVGDGINMAGWILSRGSPTGFVVSEAFKDALRQRPTAGVEFHDPRVLRPDDRPAQRLFLMSIGHPQSTWMPPTQPDRERLKEALESKEPWSVIYYAKRIMEVNTEDAQARRAIQRLRDLKLEYKVNADGEVATRINPFLGFLDSRSLLEVLRSGELVERHYNEAICSYGDEGDTMFVILRGQVGVFRPGGSAIGEPGRPAFEHEAGEIVGELAFALKRRRTADLVALSEVAMLSFNYNEIERHARELPARSGQELLRQVSRHVLSRTLEHTCHQVPYLLGRQRSGPLARADRPWDALLDDLLYHTREIRLDRHADVSAQFLQQRHEEPAPPEGGVYILVSGSLKSQYGNRRLVAEEYPLLCVDLPGDLAGPDQRFRVEEPAKALHLSGGAFDELPAEVREEVIHGLKQELRHCYEYDVFISYNSEDRQVAERWRRGLEANGFRVYMDTQRLLDRFPERISTAILNSLVMLAFISAHTVTRPANRNWVRAEVRFREAKLAANPCILPVVLAGGRPEDVAHGYTPITVERRDEADCIDEASQAIWRIHRGEAAPPFDREWHPDVQLTQPLT